MCFVKITDLTKQLGLSSRTLRYYEQVGLISSIRPQFETFRYYDKAAVERLHQIMILRKMQMLLMTDTESFAFGAKAFCTWAEDIENGRFEHVKPEEFDRN